MPENHDWKRRLAIVSDEAAPSFKEAVKICLPLGIRHFELRLLRGKRVPFVLEESIREVEEEVARNDIEVIGINPGFGKIPVDDSRVEEELTEGLDTTFRLMERLSVKRMAMFTYLRTDPDAPIPEEVFEHLGNAAKRCRAEGYDLLLENVPSVWGNTGTRLASIAEHTGLRVIWDPANSDASGEASFPTGYQAIQPFVESFHLKNWDPEKGYVYLNDGVADLGSQVRALVEAGYPGYFCIESHRWDDPDATRINTELLMDILKPL